MFYEAREHVFRIYVVCWCNLVFDVDWLAIRSNSNLAFDSLSHAHERSEGEWRDGRRKKQQRRLFFLNPILYVTDF